MGSSTARSRGLFFDGRPTAAYASNAFRGTIFQRPLDFSATAANRGYIHSRHLRQELIATVANTHRFRRHKPPPLIFVQTTHQQIDSPVNRLVRMIRRPLAERTFTLVYR